MNKYGIGDNERRNLVLGLPQDHSAVQGPFANPFNLFPENVWEDIFGYLNDPQDFQNIINASPYWRSAFSSLRTQILFPLVLDVVFSKENNEMNQNRKLKSITNLVKEDILNLRCVCSFWNRGILRLIQRNLEQQIFVPFDINSLPKLERNFHVSAPVIKNWFTHELNEFQLESLMTKVKENGKFNPFAVSKFFGAQDRTADGIQTEVDVERNYMNYIRMRKVLQRFGSQLCHLQFTIRSMIIEEYYAFLKKCLSLTPNLRTLELTFKMEGHVGFDLREDSRKWMEKIKLVESQISENPLSTMENLVTLQINSVLGPICRELLRNCPNLERLRIEFDFGVDKGRSTLKECLPRQINIRLLHLTEFMVRLRSSDDFQSLQQSPFLEYSPLRKLQLHFRENFCKQKFEPFLDWCAIFRFTEKFGNTLEELVISLPKATAEKDRKMILEESANPLYQLNLPKLKKLTLTLPNLASLDFLQSLGNSLRELSITLRHDEGETQEFKMRNETEFSKRYLEPNNHIWDKLKLLRILAVNIVPHGKNAQWGENFHTYIYDMCTRKAMSL